MQLPCDTFEKQFPIFSTCRISVFCKTIKFYDKIPI